MSWITQTQKKWNIEKNDDERQLFGSHSSAERRAKQIAQKFPRRNQVLVVEKQLNGRKQDMYHNVFSLDKKRHSESKILQMKQKR